MRLGPPPRSHFTGKMGPPPWTWAPLPSFAYGSTAPPAHVNACHSLCIKRVKSAEVRISVSWRSQRRKIWIQRHLCLCQRWQVPKRVHKGRETCSTKASQVYCSERHFSVQVSNSILVCCTSICCCILCIRGWAVFMVRELLRWKSAFFSWCKFVASSLLQIVFPH